MSENEANDFTSTANVIYSGTAITGQLASETDIDYCSLATTSAGTVTIDFDPSVNSSIEYYSVSLRDSPGTLLASQEVGRDTKFETGVSTSGT